MTGLSSRLFVAGLLAAAAGCAARGRAPSPPAAAPNEAVPVAASPSAEPAREPETPRGPHVRSEGIAARPAKAPPVERRRVAPEVERAIAEKIAPPRIPDPRLPLYQSVSSSAPEGATDETHGTGQAAPKIATRPAGLPREEPDVVVTPLLPGERIPDPAAWGPPAPGLNPGGEGVRHPPAAKDVTASPRPVPHAGTTEESPRPGTGSRTSANSAGGGTTPAVGPAPAAPQPLPFEAFVGQQSAMLRRDPADRKTRDRLAVLQTLEGKLDEADGLLAGQDTSGNEYLALTRAYLSWWLGDNAKGLASLKDVADRWERTAGFDVAAPVLCARVDGFREYAPLPAGAALRPGAAVYLYAEVLRPKFLAQPDGSWKMHLNYLWTLEDAGGRGIAVAEWDRTRAGLVRDDVRELRGPVQEVYTPVAVKVPAVAISGEYRIRLAVEDRLSGRRAEVLFPLTIQREAGR